MNARPLSLPSLSLCLSGLCVFSASPGAAMHGWSRPRRGLSARCRATPKKEVPAALVPGSGPVLVLASGSASSSTQVSRSAMGRRLGQGRGRSWGRGVCSGSECGQCLGRGLGRGDPPAVSVWRRPCAAEGLALLRCPCLCECQPCILRALISPRAPHRPSAAWRGPELALHAGRAHHGQ